MAINPSPISRTPRSVLATDVGIGDEMRKHFANTEEARGRGWRIELGLGGGRDGGKVVAEGPPRELAADETATSEVLAEAQA